MTIKLFTEHHLEFLNFKGGCRGSSESTSVNIPIIGNHMQMSSGQHADGRFKDVRGYSISYKISACILPSPMLQRATIGTPAKRYLITFGWWAERGPRLYAGQSSHFEIYEH